MGGGGTAPDTTPPTVTYTAPANGAIDVAVNTSFNVTFSEAMSTSTINSATFTLRDNANNPVNGIVTFSGTTATFTPSANIAFSTTYTATIATEVKDLAGNAMSGSYSWSFTTGVAPDTTAPIVNSTAPANGATNVAVNTPVSVNFSEAMDSATINSATFILKDSFNNSISGTVAYSGTTVTFTPNANLSFSTTYTVTITTGVKDLAGNALASDQIWAFTTGASATFTVSKSGTGTGTVTSTPTGINCGADCTETYADGTEVTFTAIPEAGSIFEGFSGGCSSIKPTCALTLTGDVTITAIFNTSFVSAAGNQLGLDGADNVAVHEQASNPPTSALDLSTFTIEAWIYSLADTNMIIVADSAYYLMVKSQPLRVEFAVMTSTGFPAFMSFAGTINPLKLNQWNHVVGMVDNSTRKLQIAVNGEMSGTLTMGATVDLSYPQTFSVGNSYPQILGDFPFIGRIDEVRLSSVIRYSGNFSPTPLLNTDGFTVGLWHFDEAEGATIFSDASGNSNTLTALGGASTIAGTRASSIPSFSIHNYQISNGNAAGLATADINNDRNADLVAAYPEVPVLLGSGSGNFSAAYYVIPNTWETSLAIGDLNNDGNADIAVALQTANSVLISLGTGTGTFESASNNPVGGWPLYPDIADFNGDGNQDVAVANLSSGNISLLMGNGDGTFSSAANYSVGTSPVSVAHGDFNSDGVLDIVVANRDSNNISILLGTGSGNFFLTANYAAGNGPFSVAVGDLNGDGKDDLAVADVSSKSIMVFLGAGDGSFGEPSSFAVPGAPRSVVIKDINSDGRLDLISANTGYSPPQSSISILLSTVDGSFGWPINYSPGLGTENVVAADFNNDGKVDLATTNFYSGTISVLIQQ